MSVDPVIAAREVGVNVFAVDLPLSERGRMLPSPAYDGTDILLNETMHPAEQRLVCAQLLGIHTTVNPFRFDDEHIVVNHRGLDMGPNHEGDAWSFAGRLLMPRPLVSDVSREAASVVDVADMMRVPISLATGRVRRLGVILPAGV